MEMKLLRPGGDCADALALRIDVFVREQGFSPEGEADALDALSWHVVYADGEGPAATGRVYFADGRWHIGRVAVAKRARGTGLGRVLMERLEQVVLDQGGTDAVLGAQCRAREFYAKLGYRPCGEVYRDEWCPHVPMEKRLTE